MNKQGSTMSYFDTTKTLNFLSGKALPITFILLLGFSFPLFSQEGHPLVGSWSGDRLVSEQNTRVLLLLDLQIDQEITGTLLENGVRIPLSNVTLDPENWSVSMNASGEDRAGNALNYEIQGVIDNLGSATQRIISGTWNDGSNTGSFRLQRN
tara:strand:+ start:1009 stop:1467 length:459 start_codon:yes stop_codon:yes gene_type:complete